MKASSILILIGLVETVIIEFDVVDYPFIVYMHVSAELPAKVISGGNSIVMMPPCGMALYGVIDKV